MPPHRFTPLKNSWDKIVTTVVVKNKLIGKHETLNKDEHQKEMR